MQERILNAFPQGKFYSLRKGGLILIPECTETDCKEICRVFDEAGWHCTDKQEEGGVQFASYTDGKQMAQLSWCPRQNTARVILEDYADLPVKKLDRPAVTTPLITQMRLTYFAHDCGMVYLIRLSDGRFVVIDGGLAEYDEPEHFLKLLDSQNVLEGKPVIAAWFVTHPHCDHQDLLIYLMKSCPERFVLERFAYNFPTDDRAKGFSLSVAQLFEMEENLTATQVLTPRTGQRWYLGDATFDILYSSDDVCHEFMNNVNETSLVMRMELGGYRVLWLADAQGIACNQICRTYDPESLRCDILQVGHHGYTGGSPELFRRADPQVLIWPVPDCRYYEMYAYEYGWNDHLIQSKKITDVYVSGRQDYVLDMTKKPEDWRKQLELPEINPGDVLFSADFAGGSVYDLGWSCLVGGGIPHKPLNIELAEGECKLTMLGEDRACCELIQPHRMMTAPGYTLTLKGRSGSVCEEVGLYWNFHMPKLWKPENLLKLELGPDEDFEYQLCADYCGGTATLYRDGQAVWQDRYIANGRRGIYLLMKNAELTLREVKIVKGDC